MSPPLMTHLSSCDPSFSLPSRHPGTIVSPTIRVLKTSITIAKGLLILVQTNIKKFVHSQITSRLPPIPMGLQNLYLCQVPVLSPKLCQLSRHLMSHHYRIPILTHCRHGEKYLYFQSSFLVPWLFLASNMPRTWRKGHLPTSCQRNKLFLIANIALKSLWNLIVKLKQTMTTVLGLYPTALSRSTFVHWMREIVLVYTRH